MEAPDSIHVGPWNRAALRIEGPARKHAVSRVQHQRPVGLQDHHGEPVRSMGTRYRCPAQPLPLLQALPLRHDTVRARLVVVVQPVPAVPASAVASHLRQPGPDPLRWRRQGRGHRRPVVGIGDELVAGVGTGGLVWGGAPGQHLRPDPQGVKRRRGGGRREAEQMGSGSVSSHFLSVPPPSSSFLLNRQATAREGVLRASATPGPSRPGTVIPASGRSAPAHPAGHEGKQQPDDGFTEVAGHLAQHRQVADL